MQPLVLEGVDIRSRNMRMHVLQFEAGKRCDRMKLDSRRKIRRRGLLYLLDRNFGIPGPFGHGN